MAVTDSPEAVSPRAVAFTSAEIGDRAHVEHDSLVFTAYESGSPGGYAAKRRSTIDALCPPKPDEFETATPTSASRASFGT